VSFYFFDTAILPVPQPVAVLLGVGAGDRPWLPRCWARGS